MPTAKADVPLFATENLVLSKQRLALDINVNYQNQTYKGIVATSPIVIQTGANSFITIPSKIAQINSITDAVIISPKFRYGFTDKLEIYSRFDLLASQSRSTDVDNKILKSDKSNLANISLGFNYQILENTDTPALLFFVENAIHEKNSINTSNFQNWNIGFTSYHAIDPIVLAVTASSYWNLGGKNNNLYTPGNYMVIQPTIAFAANSQITLTSGIQWINKHADLYLWQRQGYRQTSIAYQFGTGIQLKSGDILNIITTMNSSGGNGASLRFSYSHKF